MRRTSSAAGALLIAATLLGTGTVNAQDQWRALFDRPFSSGFSSHFRDDAVAAIAAFNGQIYIGTGGDDSAHIYRLLNASCRVWEDVSPPWEPAYVPSNVAPFWWSSMTGGESMALQTFKNHLYVGTDVGEVLRSADGTVWQNVTGDWADNWDGTIDEVWALEEFGGYLYVAFGTVEIWRTDGASWEPVVGPAPAKHGYAFGEAGKRDLRSLETFKGHLYAGVGKDGWNGIQLWRTSDGVNWTKYEELFQGPPPNYVLFPPGHVHALKGFQGYLHVGESEGVGLYRTDGSTASDGTAKVFSYHGQLADGTGMSRFEERAGTLFLGMYNFAFRPCDACPLVYQSTNGTQWQTVPGSPVNNQDHQSVSSLLASSVTSNSGGPNLYVGTSNLNDPRRLIIYQYGPSPGSCVANLAKKSVQDLSQSIGGVQQRLERCQVLPCLLAHPPLIRPLPPSDVIPEIPFEAPLVDEIVRAVETEMVVTPDDEELKDLVVQDLGFVRLALVGALAPFAGDVSEVDWATVEASIGWLDNAQALCHRASVLLSLMNGEGPKELPLDWGGPG
jgi:hypothetical protein